MKKLFLNILLTLLTFAAMAQTPFPNGISLRNAQQTLVADSIPVMGANGKINSYISVSDLIGEGQITEQDNKIQVIDIGAVDLNTPSVASAINARPNFTIAEDEIYYFTAFAVVNSPNQVGGILHTSVLNNKGKGTYGVGGEQLLSTDIRIIFQRPFIFDLSEIPSTQTINLGDVGSNDIVTAWNNHTFTGSEDPVQEQNEGYVLIDVIIDGEPLEYLFVGVGGNYGTGGNLTATIDDFVLLDNEVFDNRDLWRIASGSVGNDTGIPATLYTQPMRHGAPVFAPRFGPSGGFNNGVQNADTNWLSIKGNQGLNLYSINPNQGHVRVTSNGNLTSYALPLTKFNLRAGRNFNDNIVPGLDNYKFIGIEIDDVVDISTKTGTDSWYAALRINPALSGTGKHYSILSERGDALFKTGTFTVGTQNNTTGFGAISLGGILTNEAAVGLTHGLNHRNRGFTNFLTGIGHDVRSMNVTVVGQAAEVIDEQILDFNITADKDLFVVGNGDIQNNDIDYTVTKRSNALRVRKNGEILAPSTELLTIDNETTGKILVTKEWVESKNYDSIPTLQGILNASDAESPGYLFASLNNLEIEDDFSAFKISHTNRQNIEAGQNITLSSPEVVVSNGGLSSIDFKNSEIEFTKPGTFQTKIYNQPSLFENSIQDGFNGLNITSYDGTIEAGLSVINDQNDAPVTRLFAYNHLSSTYSTLQFNPGFGFLSVAGTTNTFSAIIEEKGIEIRRSGNNIDYYGLRSTIDLTNVVPSDKLIFAQRSYVDANKNKTDGYTVATLPTGVIGQIAHVTDAASISYRAVATGGGTDVALVMFDGTNWIYH